MNITSFFLFCLFRILYCGWVTMYSDSFGSVETSQAYWASTFDSAFGATQDCGGAAGGTWGFKFAYASQSCPRTWYTIYFDPVVAGDVLYEITFYYRGGLATDTNCEMPDSGENEEVIFDRDGETDSTIITMQYDQTEFIYITSYQYSSVRFRLKIYQETCSMVDGDAYVWDVLAIKYCDSQSVGDECLDTYTVNGYDGYSENGYYYYHDSSTAYDFYSARSLCKTIHPAADLFIPETSDLNQQMLDTIRSDSWIGVYNMYEEAGDVQGTNHYLFISSGVEGGSISYTNWGSTPSYDYECAYMSSSTSSWYEADCSSTKTVTCQLLLTDEGSSYSSNEYLNVIYQENGSDYCDFDVHPCPEYYENCFGIHINDSDVCRSNGECIAPNDCNCSTHFYGDECQYCNRSYCNGRGDCSVGELSPFEEDCDCDIGYYGIQCSYYDNDFFTLKSGYALDIDFPSVFECSTDFARVSGRSRSSGFYYGNHKIYIFGGWGLDQNNDTGYLNDVWYYNTESHQWCFVCGETTKNSKDQSDFFATSPALSQWVSSSNNGPTSRASHSSVAQPYSFFVFGGEGPRSSSQFYSTNDLWEFSVIHRTRTHQWRLLFDDDGNDYPWLSSTQPSRRSDACASQYRMTSDFAYLFGGQNYVSGAYEYYNDLWRYEFSTNTFTRLRSATFDDTFSQIERYNVDEYYQVNQSDSNIEPPRRSKCTCWTDSSSNFFLFGGEFSNKFSTSDMWKYDVVSANWIFLLGGTNNTENEVSVFGQYHSTNLPSPRSGAISFFLPVTVELDDLFLLFGGRDGRLGKQFGDLWVFSSSFGQFKFVNGTEDSVFGTNVQSSIDGLGYVIGARSFGVGFWKPNFGVYIFGGERMN